MSPVRRALTNPRLSFVVLILGLVMIAAVPAGLTLGASRDQAKTLRPPAPPLDDSAVVVGPGVQAPAPPPKEMVLVDKSGFIESPNWDDRHLSPEQKAADPVVNPRWAPFARCMQGHGVAIARAPSEFRQGDLDALVSQLNSDGPLVDTSLGLFTVRHSPALDAYVACAFATLELPSDDLYKVLTPAELATAQEAGDAPADSPSAQGR